MFKRFSILTIVSLFSLTIIYTVTTAQEKKEKFISITGKVKEIDTENQTITITNRTRKSEIIDYDIRVNTQTKYVFVMSINDLEPGNVVTIKCKRSEGGHEAVKGRRIKY